MCEVTALLPIKKNSERVPNKNFKKFKGKPLYRWVLEKLIVIEDIKKIIINTDADDILSFKDKIFKNKKIILRKRNYNIRGDKVSMNKIIEDDLNFSGNGDYLQTHSTNPLISTKTIINAIGKYFSEKKLNNADSLFTTNKLNSRFYDENCKPINHNLKKLLPTQYLKPMFEENSNLYIFNYQTFKKNNNRIGKNPIMFETPILESIDIDTENDWLHAEVLAKYIL